MSALETFEKGLALGTPNRGIVSFAVATLHAQGNRVDDAFETLEGMKPQLRFFAARLRADAVFEGLRKNRVSRR